MDLCKQSYSYQGNRNIDDFEVRTFELQLVDVQPARSIYEKSDKEKKEREILQADINFYKNKISKLVPEIPIHSIKKLYNAGFFSDGIEKLLREYFEAIEEKEKKLNSK